MKMNPSNKTKQIKRKYICEACDLAFTPVRSDARYCTKKCYDDLYNRANRIIKPNSSLLINDFNDNLNLELDKAINLEGLSSYDRCIQFLSQLPISKDGSEFPYAQFKAANFNFLAFSRRYESPPGSGLLVLEFGEFEITHIKDEIILVKKTKKHE